MFISVASVQGAGEDGTNRSQFEARLPARKFRHHICVGHNSTRNTGNTDVLNDKKGTEVVCSEMGA